MTMYAAGLDYGPDADAGYLFGGDGKGPAYANWEAEKLMMCVCDWGLTAPDCSVRADTRRWLLFHSIPS